MQNLSGLKIGVPTLSELFTNMQKNIRVLKPALGKILAGYFYCFNKHEMIVCLENELLCVNSETDAKFKE